MKYLHLRKEDYGDLLPYIEDEGITDINWNGHHLWIDDECGRYSVDDKLNETFVSVFCQKLSNLVNENFNKYYPLLEAETDRLRISVVHDSVTNTGYSISIRKTPPVRKITKESIQNGYCTKELDDFMQACIKSRMSVIVCGIPGSGKTEYVKYLTQFISSTQRVITIEDNLELRYASINPGHDCVEFKVDEDFTYSAAIKTSLRQRPDWILLSEARSREVQYLLESSSTGTGCITTIHVDTAQNIPERIMNMLGKQGEDMENTIYSFFHIGVLVRRTQENNSTVRQIYEVCLFDREQGENKVVMLYRDGKFLTRKIPISFVRKFKENKVENPLYKGGRKNENKVIE
ncbi:ATPase, T2SS/T4P/T4SS family [Tannockella kyphosi]|uniref:ATPase, T2SS/T4P/T4SS family n=1 Tax=Tannockella kyphosi TaxID=2899121 RepID=UPI002011EEF7|nr:ATPase, T2SS/T4P/T4SS family [Tannockella kyphosi]